MLDGEKRNYYPQLVMMEMIILMDQKKENYMSFSITEKPGNYRCFFHFLVHQLDDFSQCPRLRWVVLGFCCIYQGLMGMMTCPLLFLIHVSIVTKDYLNRLNCRGNEQFKEEKCRGNVYPNSQKIVVVMSCHFQPWLMQLAQAIGMIAL